LHIAGVLLIQLVLLHPDYGPTPGTADKCDSGLDALLDAFQPARLVHRARAAEACALNHLVGVLRVAAFDTNASHLTVVVPVHYIAT
jgi:hypothetical protein